MDAEAYLRQTIRHGQSLRYGGAIGHDRGATDALLMTGFKDGRIDISPISKIVGIDDDWRDAPSISLHVQESLRNKFFHNSQSGKARRGHLANCVAFQLSSTPRTILESSLRSSMLTR